MQRSGNFWRCLLTPQLLACIAIGLAGCLAIYNATIHKEQPFYFVSRQLVWLAIGIIILFICSHIQPTTYDKWVYPLSGMALLCLYALLFWGTRISGMRGWFEINTTFLGTIYFQPSEISKPIFVLFLARLTMFDRGKIEKDGIILLIRTLLFISLWLSPILLQPNFSSFVLYTLVFLIMYWLKGGKIVPVTGMVLGFMLMILIIAKRADVVPVEFFEFLKSVRKGHDGGTHVFEFKSTLAQGGLWGRDAEEVFWSKAYLPLGYSDSIFATLGESIGFIGVVTIVIGIILWMLYCVHIAKQQVVQHYAVIIAGMSTMLIIQAFIHVSATLGILPSIGIGLPMFSYGGSSLVATLASIGIIFSLANYKEERIENVNH